MALTQIVVEPEAGKPPVTPEIPKDGKQVADDATEKALLAAKAARAGTIPPTEETRPDHIPEKFWTGNLEESTKKAMASYAELETKLAQGTGGETDEQKAAAKVVADKAAADAAAKAGAPKPTEITEALFAEATAEYAERGGSLSPQMYDKLSAQGIGAGQVNKYIAGQESLNTGRTTMLATEAGDQATLDAAVQWAGTNYSPEQGAEFNASVDGESDVRAKDAVTLLMQRYTAAGGTSSLVTSAVERTPGGVKPFGSMQEMMKAQKDPRYKDGDTAFHAEFNARLLASQQQKSF